MIKFAIFSMGMEQVCDFLEKLYQAPSGKTEPSRGLLSDGGRVVE